MSYQVTAANGTLLGIFPAISDDMKALVHANSGAKVKAVATITNPCTTHPAFEVGNCPGCGTQTAL